MTIEYRVRPVTRYIITRFEETDDGLSGSEVCGEFNSAGSANKICDALAAHEGGEAKAFLMQEHASDCAVHNMPAMPEGACDCGAVVINW